MKNRLYIIYFLLLIFLITSCSKAPDEGAIQTAIAETQEANPTATETIPSTKTVTNTPEPTITGTSTATSIPTHTPTPQPTVTENPFFISPGTYLIGDDIMPGIYYGKVGDSLLDSCYWERLKDLSGEFDSIIANGNGMGQFYIEIKETDFAFSIDCEVVHIDEVPIPESFIEELDVGMYIIGRDIQPGLYQGIAGNDIMESCYWERLRDVSGSFNSIIANGNGVGQYYIQVSPSDFALSVACPVTYQGE